MKVLTPRDVFKQNGYVIMAMSLCCGDLLLSVFHPLAGRWSCLVIQLKQNMMLVLIMEIIDVSNYGKKKYLNGSEKCSFSFRLKERLADWLSIDMIK